MKEQLRKQTFELSDFRTGVSVQNAYQITTSGLEEVLEYEERLSKRCPTLGAKM